MKTHFQLLSFLILLQCSSVVAQKSNKLASVDSLKQKLFTTRYYIDKKEVDSLTFKNKESKLITEVSHKHKIGEYLSFYDCENHREGIISGHKHNKVIITCDSVDTYEVPVETKDRTILKIIPSDRKYIPYTELNDYYSCKGYRHQKGDYYRPWIHAASSLIIPGSGQMATGEVLRGFGFLGATVLSYGTILYGAFENWGSQGKDGVVWIIAGTAGIFAIPVWSAVDAYKVASVRSLYNRDKKNFNAVSISLLPYSKPVPYSLQPGMETGLALNIRF